MGRQRSTWKLVRQSFAVLMREKKLLFFPVVSSLLTVFIVLFSLAPIPLQPTGHSYLELAHWEAVAETILQLQAGSAQELELDRWFLGYQMLLYLLWMFLLTFFNTAFFHEILNALNGRPTSITGGLRLAVTKLKPIALWSLFAGVVGILIEKLEEHVGFFGRWSVALFDVVWSVASVFAVPVLIREEESANPLEVLKKSALLIRKRWGEGLIGYVGIGSAAIIVTVGLLVVFSLPMVVLGLATGSYLPSASLAGVICVWLLSSTLVACLASATNKVFQCALYVYAAEGVIPGPFDPAMLDAAWKVKKRAA